MSWDADSLRTKAALYFERAFEASKDDPMFGFWAALGLELLARSAVAFVSPTLLAEPDRDQKHLLHCLGHGGELSPKSIAASQVLNLCKVLFEDFVEEDRKLCSALINTRNEELHSGSAAFEKYKTTEWLAGFYKACKTLAIAQGHGLEELFGEEEAQAAEEIIEAKTAEVIGKVQKRIADHKKTFAGKNASDREKLSANAAVIADQLASRGHHRVICPACASRSYVKGDLYGKETISNEHGSVVVRQPAMPQSFRCDACGLQLNGYAELEAAKLAGRYHRTSKYDPAEFYGYDDSMSAPEPEEDYDNE